MEGYDKAKLEKLKEMKKALRIMMAEEGGDAEMEPEEVEELLEEAEPEDMEEPEGAGEDLPVREATMEEMEEPEDAEEEVDELTMMKREFFKPKMTAKAPGRPGAKTVIIASQPESRPQLKDAIPMPKKGKRGLA